MKPKSLYENDIIKLYKKRGLIKVQKIKEKKDD